MIKKFNLFFVTFFMIGKIKYAPGTIASLITCLIFFYCLIQLFNIVISIVFNYFNNFFLFFIAINNSFDEFQC